MTVSKVLVTGVAGFIGFHVAKILLRHSVDVIGVDNINNYYSTELKKARLSELEFAADQSCANFTFYRLDLSDSAAIHDLFSAHNPCSVVHLAAQAGVRYSIENPSAYIQSNLVGFSNIIECCRSFSLKHLLYASSSSVYGGNKNLPFSELDSVDHPVSLYAATKKSNELIAHSYSHLYGLPTTGLRFFTVYGPWGRPDMALFLFTDAILSGRPIKVFNNGQMTRDFTYVDDIVEAIYRLLLKPALPDRSFDYSKPNSASSWAPYRIFNIGNSSPISLMTYIEALENKLGIEAIKDYMPMQPGDVAATSANTDLLERYIQFKPCTTVDDGISRFVDWYRIFYNR